MVLLATRLVGLQKQGRSLPPPLILQASTMLELLRAFYSDDEDYQSVLDFNHQPSRFDFDRLLEKTRVSAAAAAGAAAIARAAGPPPPS